MEGNLHCRCGSTALFSGSEGAVSLEARRWREDHLVCLAEPPTTAAATPTADTEASPSAVPAPESTPQSETTSWHPRGHLSRDDFTHVAQCYVCRAEVALRSSQWPTLAQDVGGTRHSST